jgi:hypothetical protein
MSDKYFRDKVAETINKLADAKSEADYDQILFIAFKEVARDQRHACYEAGLQNNELDVTASAVFNAEPVENK